MKKKKVAVAMSGGIDSSFAAYILKKQGFDVMGLTMNIVNPSGSNKHTRNQKKENGFYKDPAEDAHQVAKFLDIDHHSVDLREIFEKKIVANFCREYSKGYTPNPCVRCNQLIKFGVLLNKLKDYNADYLATGHHSLIEFDKKTNRYILKKGKDREKDQSYFLYTLTQEQLSRILMPVGNFRKKEIIKISREIGLPAFKSKESQEICFIPDDNYIKFLKERVPGSFSSGKIVDLAHNVLGYHKGIAHFTIGQRKGMGISHPQPLYVLHISAKNNTVTVGPDQCLHKKDLLASNVNFISQEKIEAPQFVKAKIRYNQKESKAWISPAGKGKIKVKFSTPQRAISPGQSVVFYWKDTVVGGGIIEKETELSL